MIRPMPFWPSFEPCAKLTPVQVRIRMLADPQRRRRGALRLAYSSGRRATSFSASSSRAAAQKPMSGDSSSE